MSRLSQLTVTRKPSSLSRPMGWSAMERMPGTADVCRFEEGHISRGMRLSRMYAASSPSLGPPSAARSMSSMMRTPWPRRSAPQRWMACQIDGSPNASPAWMVKCAFSRRRYSNASRCRIGGKPSSAPAMSKPQTPRSRYSTTSSAISSPCCACRMAVRSWPTTMGVPSSRASATPSSMPAWTASTVSASDSPPRRCCSGAQRSSAYTTPSAARSSTDSRATRARSCGRCMTATVCSNVSR